MKVLNILINEYYSKAEALAVKRSPEAKDKQLYIRKVKDKFSGGYVWLLYERLID